MRALHDLGAELLGVSAVLFIGWVWVFVCLVPARGDEDGESWP